MQNNSPGFAIAIDGPVASGKGTIAPKIAKAFNGFYLYTGGMYRAAALYCMRKNVDLELEEEVLKALNNCDIKLNNEQVILNNEDVTLLIKDREVANRGSKIAVYKTVRQKLVERQQAIAKEEIEKGNVVVAEDRDIATKVLPQAEVKIFLTAKSRLRALRRLRQYWELGVRDITIDDVHDEILKRDQNDTEREIDPLVKDPEKIGYVVLDDSHLTEEETLKKALSIIEEKRK